MASHNEIVAFLDDFLEIGSFSDYGPNGLLVPGAEEVTRRWLPGSVPSACSSNTPFGQEPFVWDAGPELVHSVGMVSGSATDAFDEAIALGLDAFLTGEPAFGIRRLGELVSERFGVEHGSWTFPIRSSQKTYAKSKKRLRCPRQALP